MLQCNRIGTPTICQTSISGALVIIMKMKIFGGTATNEEMEVFKGELAEKLDDSVYLMSS